LVAMDTLTEVPGDAARVERGCAADTAQLQEANGTAVANLPRRSRTRQGKARLLTLECLDQRTAAYHAAVALIASLTSDLGGDDQLSAGERELIRRAALCGAILADFEARWVAGQEVALADYLSAVNVQRRVLATLGLRRRPRDVRVPSLEEIVTNLERSFGLPVDLIEQEEEEDVSKRD